MTREIVIAAGVLLLAACGAPIRTYAWYKAHPGDAAAAAAACGPRRSQDCANAERAVADAASDRRLNAYRKAF